MTMRMLIDARHREETRVAVVKGNRIEEFDFESAERKQLKGNIYLAKVTRVEPSLQAAFIDYGGNRHGFLAFSEIHPDYYQIPKEDREALLREEAEHAAEEERLRAGQDDDHDDAEELDGTDADLDLIDDEDEDAEETDDATGDAEPAKRGRRGGDEAAAEALRERRLNLRRRYKIQDVIRRRQVLLVQVVKEERGNKGAALTTYLSLAGRYCVLMPNTAHGGGISRKISSAADRKRLKSIMAELTLPSTMGCIVRTAGLQRTRTEIKRDFDYLARLWDGIRDKTLQSEAPSLVHGDSDLMKRAIRDIYNKDIDEVIVEGEDGYRQAKEHMRLLMPSHARRVKQYADAVPLFQRAHVEDQLAAMYNPVVQLKSGGYLVINPTEALVSIDINSGRSTREHNIEQTATATNLEAAQEIARQLRLRDMAGLVVIDFIDMDHSSNVRKVEKAMKEALKNDRARIQVGRISSFGLMEMSRQRLRTGVLEASTRQCPHCEGTGLVRTASSSGLSALRLIEDEAARGHGSVLTLRASQEAAFYVLNKKRADIAEIEDRYGVVVEILADAEIEGARMTVEASGPPPAHAPRIEALVEDLDDDLPEDVEDTDEEEAVEEVESDRDAPVRDEDGEGGRKRRRRSRRRRGRNRDEDQVTEAADDHPDDVAEPEDVADDEAVETDAVAAEPAEERSGEGRKRRRRGRRGGRRSESERSEAAQDEPVAEAGDAGPIVDPVAVAESPEPVEAETETVEAIMEAEAPKPAAPKRTRRRPSARTETPASAVDETAADGAVAGDAAVEAKPKRTRRKKADTAAAEVGTGDTDVSSGTTEEAEKPKPKRRAPRKKVAATEQDTAPSDPEATLGTSGAVPLVDAQVDVAADAEVAAGDTDENAPPVRRGWWQRTFGN